MAKRSRQTFKKRQREMARDQKRKDKAKRIAERKTGETDENTGAQLKPEECEEEDDTPTLKIFAVGKTKGDMEKK